MDLGTLFQHIGTFFQNIEDTLAMIFPGVKDEPFWSLVVDTASKIAAIIVFIYAVLQIISLKEGIIGSTQDRLYGQYGEICKQFMSKPYLRAHFYDNLPFTENPPDNMHLRVEIDAMSEK
jgi:hypothetical protein